jgi:carbon-monoxide dehydrogenase small subunit
VIIQLRVNGEDRVLDVADDELLLDALHRRLDLTSVREGCGVGACGACTVLIDGKSVSGCLVLASRCEGKDIVTSEGLGASHPVVSSFVDCGALQCGYCIPGFVLMATELLGENPQPDQQAIHEHLEGNICRCATYPDIVRAVHTAAEKVKAGAALTAGAAADGAAGTAGR